MILIEIKSYFLCHFTVHLSLYPPPLFSVFLSLSLTIFAYLSKVKSGVKRKKADTTTPSSTVNDIPASPVTPIEVALPYLSGKVRSRRESHRSIKRPNKDLPGEDLAKV